MKKNPRTHDSISQVAREIWETRNRPTGCDLEIWLEAEKQSGVTSPHAVDQSTKTGRGSGESQQSTTAADPVTTQPAATPKRSVAKAAQRKQNARAPQSAVKANHAKAEPPETGKPLWPKPKSR